MKKATGDGDVFPRRDAKRFLQDANTNVSEKYLYKIPGNSGFIIQIIVSI